MYSVDNCTTSLEIPISSLENCAPEIPQKVEKEKPKTPEKPKFTPSGTVEWIAKQIHDRDDRALAHLQVWVHNGRWREATADTLHQLRTLSTSDAIFALRELHGPIRFIKGRKGRQLDLSLTLTIPADERSFSIQALVDSGCTGSCIDEKFVRENNIPTKSLPLPIPVYNTNRTINIGGPIREFVDCRIAVKDHVEKIVLAVTNLGNSKVFLGHDWLQLHNPNVDWREGTITLDRCPEECNYYVRVLEPEAEEEDDVIDEEAKWVEGDRVFAIDYVGYFESRGISLDLRAATTVATDLAHEQYASKSKKTFEEIVPSHYHDFKDVFAKESFDELPEQRPWDHAIELTPGSKPLDCKIYPLSPEEQRELDEFLQENLKSKRIRPSKSPMASPFFFVKKKDGRLRPVQDYHKLNDMTVKNRYPLPLIQDLIGKLKGARYFTKLDVRWGYNNVRIREGDKWKAAFRTPRGLFEPLVMFFGLTNSPATFQTMMNDLFRDLITRGVVAIYVDDILIYTKTLAEHRRVVREVLQILRDNKLFLKDEKCEFEVTETEYLGVIISQGEVKMDPVKVAGIMDWPRPRSKRDIQAFLGFTNFYRRFIKDYGGMARALTQLTGNADFTWGPEQQLAFEAIKNAIGSSPVLGIPTDDDPYRLECDASDYAIGAVLSQRHNDIWKPIAFLSKAMNPTERNYEIYDKELLAIMTALDEYRHYLMGAVHDVEIWTDHKNLEYFRKPQKVNRRQARWVSELANYHYTLHHKPGKMHTKPDLLSRRADHEKGERDNEDVVVLKPEVFRRSEFELKVEEDEIITRIRASRGSMDKSVKKMLEKKEIGWTDDGKGLITWRDRIYIPRDRGLRERIIRLNHDTPSAGHPGRNKTHELITRDYWWPNIQRDVRKYVEGCEACQRTKIHHGKKATPLHPHLIAKQNWEVISVDMIGPLPESNGHNALIHVVDTRSKQLIAIPADTDLTAEGWATLFIQNVYRRVGLPRKIISDRGVQFVSKFIKALYDLLGIKGNPSTAYHPQTDGQTERVNQDVENYL